MERPEILSKRLAKLINRQARSITGMYQSSTISPSMIESSLPRRIFYSTRQRIYEHRILSLPGTIPTKDIFPISLIEDGNAQPEDLLEWDSI